MADRFPDDQDAPSNPTENPRLGRIAARRLRRRTVLGGLAGTAAALGIGRGPWPGPATAAAPGGLDFTEIAHGVDTTHHVPPGYRAEVLARWGDPVLAGAPAFDPRRLTATSQASQFGYNNDFIAYMPLPAGSGSAGHGLLCVNHEYTNAELMWPGLDRGSKRARMTAAQVAVEMAAHGHTVVEVRRRRGRWHLVPDGPYNRRITAGGTVMRMSGPAAGHPRLITRADPSGRRVIGTLNNCAGGVTPWGTVLIAEENFNFYFGGQAPPGREAAAQARYGIRGDSHYAWSRFHHRFDLAREPNEPNRFGWMVEIDPYDPASVPVKRSSLGRFKHEGANLAVAPDSRIVCYMGDDQAFEYLYRWVSSGRYVAGGGAANRDLLDDGTLYVARFEDDGRLNWLPLLWGDGPLVPANGFEGPADVLIEARRAADLLGATGMDRPEEVQHDPATGRVYVMLTNNTGRRADAADPRRRPDAANPRADNRYGHILELIPPGGAAALEPAAAVFGWNLFILCGNPGRAGVGARYNPGISADGWFAAPDNCAFDRRGRLWIASDQGGRWRRTGTADGLWACELAGADRALTRMFFRAPLGAEVTGPCFTPDDTTLFLAVQHPGADGVANPRFDSPATRWPDFAPGVPPRPSVLAITREDGGEIGA